MDSFWPIILFAIISIIIDRLDSKKKPPARRPQGGSGNGPKIILRGPHGIPLPFPMPEEEKQEPQATTGEPSAKPAGGANGKFGFEIPTLANEPPKKGPNVVYRETETVDVAEMLKEQEEEARRRQRELEKKRREVAARKAEAERYAHEAKIPHACHAPSTHHPLFTKLNPQTARDAIVLAEIIGKPKAYRNSRH